MSGDFVKRLRQAHQTMPIPSIASLYSDAADAIDARNTEIDRLRAERDAERAVVERLRVAGDALAESLAEFQDPQDDLRLLAWEEARRER